jgi:uncharacterized repeat protein (TIGR03806 family)
MRNLFVGNLVIAMWLGCLAACTCSPAGGSDAGSTDGGGPTTVDGGGSTGDGGDSTGDGGETTQDSGTDGGESSTDAGVDAGQNADGGGMFGYDARPANPTCLAPAPPPNLSGVTTTRVFKSLFFEAPLGMFEAPGDTTRVYVMERAGKVRAFPNQQTAVMGDVVTVLDFVSKVDASGEGGFLGMAFHPQWATKKEVFVSYTETGPSGAIPLRSVIARYSSTDNGLTFDAASEQRLLVLDQPYSNHDGGNIAFGPDGFLYIGVGDGGSSGDPGNRAQRLNTNLGKFLRIDVNVPFAQKYAIPPSNPFAADATPCNRTTSVGDATAATRCAEIYAWGLRNPWRWSFDTSSGELWAGDVGQGLWEEVDRIVLGGNYGWKVREGAHCYAAATCATAGLIDPVVDYDRTQGVSITGGFVYRGSLIPSLVGKFIYGDYGSGRIWALTFNATTGKYEGAQLQDTSIAIASFAQLSNGEVYVLSFNDGQILQLTPSAAPPADTFPKLLSQTGCFTAGEPVTALIPYDLNAALWSDGADKQRYFAIPDGSRITVATDGDFDFPNGSVLAKTFRIAGKRIETRLFMRHADGTWAGYSYEWNDQETDAALLPGAKTKPIGAQAWTYPSRAQCMQCHTARAGRTLGPELAQLNRSISYPSGRTRNQLDTLSGLDYFTTPLSMPASALARIEDPFGAGALGLRARGYLHANCAGCHRSMTGLDLRYTTSLAQTRSCNVAPQAGTFGLTNPQIVKPGEAAASMISYRTHTLNAYRMPPLGSSVVDAQGTTLIDQWIDSLTSCQ